MHSIWPLFGLRLRTPRLALRLPTDADVEALVDLVEGGIHGDDLVPFVHPFTDGEPIARQRGVAQWVWRNRGDWLVEHWALGLVVEHDGRLIGVQGVRATEFDLRRTVDTFSWLGLPHQGQGLGTEMRAAVLGFAFDHLGADRAESGALEGNHASLGVSTKLGYRPNGDQIDVQVWRGERRTLRQHRVVLDRADWRPPFAVEVDGFEACRAMLDGPAEPPPSGFDPDDAPALTVRAPGTPATRPSPVVRPFGESAAPRRTWPLFGLRLLTERLELRYPTDDDVFALAELATHGVHHPDLMPFLFPWTHAASPRLERGALMFQWRSRANLAPTEWHLPFVTIDRATGTLLGMQELNAKDFPVVGEAGSGSWLGRAAQRRGYGQEQRWAVAHLAFAGLGAHTLCTDAFDDNDPSNQVTRSLGYRDDGEAHLVRLGQRGVVRRYRMWRPDWEAHPTRPEVTIEGLEPCLDLLGLGASGGTA